MHGEDTGGYCALCGIRNRLKGGIRLSDSESIVRKVQHLLGVRFAKHLKTLHTRCIGRLFVVYFVKIVKSNKYNTQYFLDNKRLNGSAKIS